MAGFLASQGWVELLGSDYLTPDDLDTSILVLRSFSDYSSAPDELVKYYSFDGESRVVAVLDSLMQFYFDLSWCWADGPNCGLPVLARTDSVDSTARNRDSRFSFYRFEDNAEAYSFLTILEQNEIILCPGFYKSRGGRRIPGVQTNKLSDLRTMGAICVDIDNVTDDSPVSAENFIAAYERIPDEILPTYVSLSGNGVHLWYVFEPIQTFSESNPKRRKLRAIKEGLYNYFSNLFVGLDLKIDRNSIPLNQPVRAPGTLTKYGDLVRCFRPADRGFSPSRLSIMDISDFLCGQTTSPFDASMRLLEEDVLWKSQETLKLEADERELRKASAKSLATDKQVSYAKDLLDKEAMTEDDFVELCASSRDVASGIISRAERKLMAQSSGRELSNKGLEGFKYHRLTSGKTGGVYAKLLKAIQSKDENGRWRVQPGRRESCLYMIAGVAYMMEKPAVSRSQLEKDFTQLLYSEWGTKTYPPLTISDLKKSLTGFNPENGRSRGSIVSQLGFDPFEPSQQRNGRTLEEHLKSYVPDKRRITLARKKKEAIAKVLSEHPDATKAQVCRETGISKPTVNKYWDEVCRECGREPLPDRSLKIRKIAEAIHDNPGATKKIISEVSGLSAPTVRKYWEDACEMEQKRGL